MSIRGDFALVTLNKTMGTGGANAPIVPPGFTAAPHGASADFKVEGKPIDGYVLLQVSAVDAFRSRVRINEKELPGEDLFPGTGRGWTAWFVPIPAEFLKPGANRIDIRPAPNDQIAVGAVAIHWREQDA